MTDTAFGQVVQSLEDFANLVRSEEEEGRRWELLEGGAAHWARVREDSGAQAEFLLGLAEELGFSGRVGGASSVWSVVREGARAHRTAQDEKETAA